MSELRKKITENERCQCVNDEQQWNILKQCDKNKEKIVGKMNQILLNQQKNIAEMEPEK